MFNWLWNSLHAATHWLRGGVLIEMDITLFGGKKVKYRRLLPPEVMGHLLAQARKQDRLQGEGE